MDFVGVGFYLWLRYNHVAHAFNDDVTWAYKSTDREGVITDALLLAKAQQTPTSATISITKGSPNSQVYYNPAMTSCASRSQTTSVIFIMKIWDKNSEPLWRYQTISKVISIMLGLRFIWWSRIQIGQFYLELFSPINHHSRTIVLWFTIPYL